MEYELDFEIGEEVGFVSKTLFNSDTALSIGNVISVLILKNRVEYRIKFTHKNRDYVVSRDSDQILTVDSQKFKELSEVQDKIEDLRNNLNTLIEGLIPAQEGDLDE